MTGKRPPLHLESNTMLCMAYMSALVAVKGTLKDMPGYVSFYERSGDANHPGYCSPLFGSVMGPYSDPFDGWSADLL